MTNLYCYALSTKWTLAKYLATAACVLKPLAILLACILWFYIELGYELFQCLCLKLEATIIDLSYMTTSLDIPAFSSDYKSLPRIGDNPYHWDNIMLFIQALATVLSHKDPMQGIKVESTYPMTVTNSHALCGDTNDWVDWLDTLPLHSIHRLYAWHFPLVKEFLTRKTKVTGLALAYVSGTLPPQFDHTTLQ